MSETYSYAIDYLLDTIAKYHHLLLIQADDFLMWYQHESGCKVFDATADTELLELENEMNIWDCVNSYPLGLAIQTLLDYGMTTQDPTFLELLNNLDETVSWYY